MIAVMLMERLYPIVPAESKHKGRSLPERRLSDLCVVGDMLVIVLSTRRCQRTRERIPATCVQRTFMWSLGQGIQP